MPFILEQLFVTCSFFSVDQSVDVVNLVNAHFPGYFIKNATQEIKQA